MSIRIYMRNKKLKLNDPRCYNGCYFDAVYVWGPWEVIEICKDMAKAKQRLVGWVDLNDYAVSQRGKSAKAEFKIVIEKD